MAHSRNGSPSAAVDPDVTRRRVSPTSKFTLALLGLVLAALTAFVLVQSGLGPLPDPERCVARADGSAAALDLEQAENAAVIAGVAVRRGLPARAVTIALATAYQESDIRNVGYGDRDSLGVFQQRPSQGWGTAEQVQDLHYAANRFYDQLVGIDGYRDLPITDAAQQVQRSAFGDAYADHEPEARIVASALTGYSQAAFSCSVRLGSTDTEQTGANGLTPRAAAVLTDVQQTFGELPVGGFQPGGVTSGHMEGSAHYDGRAVDIFFRPVTEENRRQGWAVAHYLVARADRLGIQTVIFDDRIWQSGSDSDAGWRDYRAPTSSGDTTVLQHRDHVHVDVVESSG